MSCPLTDVSVSLSEMVQRYTSMLLLVALFSSRPSAFETVCTCLYVCDKCLYLELPSASWEWFQSSSRSDEMNYMQMHSTDGATWTAVEYHERRL